MEKGLVQKHKTKPVSSPRLVIRAFVTILWISLVISLVQILLLHFLRHRPISMKLIVDTCLITTTVFYTIYGTRMLCLWLFIRKLFFKVAAALVILLGIAGLVILNIFNGFNAKYAHIIVICFGMIAFGIAVWYRFIKKKKQPPLSVKEQKGNSDLIHLYEELKKRHHCPDGWFSTNINDLTISLSEPCGVKTLSIQIIPKLEICFDISLEGEKPWAEIKPLLHKHTQQITFFQTTFSFSNILYDSSDNNISLPRLTPHPAGVTGFLLCLPLPENNYFSTAEAYDQVIENCIAVAKEL